MKRTKLWRCAECQMIHQEDDLLTAPNPFDDECFLTGCPNCLSIDDFYEVCDEPGCDQDATCGFPTEDGYRRTCFEHSPFNERASPKGTDRLR